MTTRRGRADAVARAWTSRSRAISSACCSSSTAATARALTRGDGAASAETGALAGRRRALAAAHAPCSTASASTTRARSRTIAGVSTPDRRARRSAHARSASPPRAARRARPRRVPMVALATAHPAKFPDAVERGDRHAPAAAGPRSPTYMERPERVTRAAQRPRGRRGASCAPPRSGAADECRP